VTYSTSYPTKGYSDTLAALGGLPAACGSGGTGPTVTSGCLIDNVLASAIAGSAGKSGFIYNVTPVATGTINTAYTAGASPLTYNQSGVRNFCSNEGRRDPLQRRCIRQHSGNHQRGLPRLHSTAVRDWLVPWGRVPDNGSIGFISDAPYFLAQISKSPRRSGSKIIMIRGRF